MKIKKKCKAIFIVLTVILIISSFRIQISEREYRLDNRGNSKGEFFGYNNIKSSDSNFDNGTIISDGFDGKYWNDGKSIDPAIAIDSNSGIVHVVWEDDSNGLWKDNSDDSEIMYANYSHSQGWSNATVISDGYQGYYWNTNISRDPAITVDDMGNIHVVWVDSSEGIWCQGWDDTEIMYVNYTASKGWSNITIITDGFQGIYWNNDYSFSPDIAIKDDGTIYVVWTDDTNGVWGNDDEVFCVNYTKIQGWSNATVISDGYGGIYWSWGDSSHPKVATDSIGNVHIVWDDETGGPWGTYPFDSEILYVNWTSTYGWSNVTSVSDGFNNVYWNDGNSRRPDITVDDSNNLHVVWMDETDGVWGTLPEIMYANYSFSQGWSNASIISDGFQGIYQNDIWCCDPAIEVDSDKNIYVIYPIEDWVSLKVKLLIVNYTSSFGWSNNSVISILFDGTFSYPALTVTPDIAVDSLGDTHIVWVDEKNGPWGNDMEILYSSTYVPSDTISINLEDDDDNGDKKKTEQTILSFDPLLIIGVISLTTLIIILRKYKKI